MKTVKRKLFAMILCLSMVFGCPLTQIYASNTTEVGYWAESSITIDKGEPVKTGDSTDLYDCFLLLSLSTLSLFLILLVKNEKDKAEVDD